MLERYRVTMRAQRRKVFLIKIKYFKVYIVQQDPCLTLPFLFFFFLTYEFLKATYYIHCASIYDTMSDKHRNLKKYLMNIFYMRNWKRVKKIINSKENTWKICFQKLKVKEGQSTSEKMSFLISWSQICLLSTQLMTK